MGKKHKQSRYEVGDTISNYGRNLKIINKEYKGIISKKNGSAYNNHRWYYQYKCLNCGNTDWIVEYALGGNQYCGCNVCCTPPKKIVTGINDIATTNPWMVKYFANPEDATRYSKFSNAKVDMICPDCGRLHKDKKIGNVYNNKNLSCPCGDGWSYPNKFMYSLLEQIGVYFEAEKKFEWSDNRVYDNYIEYNGLKIITEQHGQQHYHRPFSKTSRTVIDERKNDEYKHSLALNNGINKYFVIDCSLSELEFLKKSIESSGLLEIFNICSSSINWEQCHDFATSNFSKRICEYKEKHPSMTLKEIAGYYKISYNTVLSYIKEGSKLGWCNYSKFDDLRMLRESCQTITNTRPIHCLTDGNYYRSSKVFVREYEEDFGKHLQERNIRSVCEGKRTHVNNLKFEYITQEEFNDIKTKTPDIAIGEFFKLNK